MAKDGTNRGGIRIGAGKKPKSLDEKILEGKADKFVTSVEPKSVEPLKAMPKIKRFMTAKQRNGEKLQTAEIYSEMWNWLVERGCENLIDNHLLEQYAMSVARWRQCEDYISKLGLIGEHPTTGGEIISVYVKMSQDYQRQINQLRYQIYSIVKENSSMECSMTTHADGMEMLFKAKRQR
ncbi:MAG: P27 family phage terminase small subunit [Selenomonadaceae bacterium]|nr:P27 family phage terminase small subunit [Selenomonadaceae bacterium]